MIRHLALAGLIPLVVACQGEIGVDNARNDDDSGLEDADEDGFFSDEDCNDLDADVYPGAPELCDDGRITDCNRKDENQTITVRDTGFDLLQDALNFANAGDDVIICPGTYVGTFVSPVPVNMRAKTNALETTLTADGAKVSGSTLSVRSGTTITGLTIRDGFSELGGGIFVVDPKGGTLELTDSIVTANTAFDGGGLYSPPGLQTTLRNTTLFGNVALASGGGAFLEAGALLRLESESVLENNTARSGGGVALLSSRLEGGVVLNNNATDEALTVKIDTMRRLRSPGGAGVLGIGTSVVEATEVTGNNGTGISGGAVMVLDGDTLTLDGVAVAGNVTQDAGGGLEIRGGNIVMTGNSQVFGNVSTSDKGSGALIEGGSLTGGTIRDHKDGGGILINNGAVTNVEITANKNTHEGGCVEAQGEVVLTNVRINECEAATGGGVFYQRTGNGQKLTVVGSTIRRNRSEVGGGIFGESVILTNTTVTQNQAGRGGGLYIVRQLVMQESTIEDNKSILGGRAAGGGIFYEPRSAEDYPPVPISVTSSNFGIPFGPTDNSPDDITFVSMKGNESYSYGLKASFDCYADTGCEEFGKGGPP